MLTPPFLRLFGPPLQASFFSACSLQVVEQTPLVHSLSDLEGGESGAPATEPPPANGPPTRRYRKVTGPG